MAYLNTITVLFEKNSCKVGYIIDDGRIRPSAKLLNSHRQVPVVDCHHWCDVVSAMEISVDDRVHGWKWWKTMVMQFTGAVHWLSCCSSEFLVYWLGEQNRWVKCASMKLKIGIYQRQAHAPFQHLGATVIEIKIKRKKSREYECELWIVMNFKITETICFHVGDNFGCVILLTTDLRQTECRWAEKISIYYIIEEQ